MQVTWNADSVQCGKDILCINWFVTISLVHCFYILLFFLICWGKFFSWVINYAWFVGGRFTKSLNIYLWIFWVELTLNLNLNGEKHFLELHY